MINKISQNLKIITNLKNIALTRFQLKNIKKKINIYTH